MTSKYELHGVRCGKHGGYCLLLIIWPPKHPLNNAQEYNGIGV